MFGKLGGRLLRSVSPADLRKWRQLVIVGAFAAGVIVPVAPNPGAHFALALTLVALFELWLLLVALGHRRHAAPPDPPPGQQRLPMAIAIPNRTRPATAHAHPKSVRRKGPATIDLRER